MSSTRKQGQNHHEHDDKSNDKHHKDAHADDDTDNEVELRNMSSIAMKKKGWPMMKFGDVVKNIANRMHQMKKDINKAQQLQTDRFKDTEERAGQISVCVRGRSVAKIP